MNFSTAQEEFWAGEFGDDYQERNVGQGLISSNLRLFAEVLDRMGTDPRSIFEIGANIGMNLEALRMLLPEASIQALEINEKAHHALERKGFAAERGSILDFDGNQTYDFVFTKGVLIHIEPGKLQTVYRKIASLAAEWLLIAEYYDPNPVALDYRGHKHRLFKRDFAGEFLDENKDFELWAHGFRYRRVSLDRDDTHWFLIRRKS